MPETFKLNITSGERKGETYPLLNFPFRIGRAADNDLVLEDKRVSRYHSEIYLINGEYSIKDLGSQNGTWVNGVKITSTGIKTGNTIIIGGNPLFFDSEGKNIFVEVDTSDLHTIIKPAKDILMGTIEEKDDGFS